MGCSVQMNRSVSRGWERFFGGRKGVVGRWPDPSIVTLLAGCPRCPPPWLDVPVVLLQPERGRPYNNREYRGVTRTIVVLFSADFVGSQGASMRQMGVTLRPPLRPLARPTAR